MGIWLTSILAQALSFSVEDSAVLRSTLAADVVSLDAEMDPGLTLALRQKRVAWTLGYFPRLTLNDFAGSPPGSPTVTHTLNAQASIAFRRAQLTLSQSGSYGTQNLRVPAIFAPPVAPAVPEPAPEVPEAMPAADPSPAPPPILAQPTLITAAYDEPIRYANSSSSVALGHVLSRRLTLSESLGYSFGSGLTTAARALYPRQDQASAGVSLGTSVSRTDTLASTLSAQLTTTKNTDARILSGAEFWSHRFSTTVNSDMGAGLAYTESVDPGGSLTSVLPVGSVSVLLQQPRRRVRHSVSLSLGVAPQVDRVSGTIDSRATWSLTGVRTRGPLTLSLNSAGTSSLDVNSANRFLALGGTAQASYAVTKEFSGALSVGGTWQDFRTATSNAPVWFGAILLTYRLAPQPF